MPYESSTNTIFLGEGESFSLESGVFFLHNLAKLAGMPNSPRQIREDYDLISRTVGIENGVIDSASEEKFREYYRDYLAVGIAPSVRLQPSFDRLRLEFDAVKIKALPQGIRAAFDRLLATDEEIGEKRAIDSKHRGSASIADVPASDPVSPAGWLSGLPRWWRAFIVLIACWACIVVFITDFDSSSHGSYGSFEFLGMEIYRWSSEMFWLNFLLPPSIAGVGRWLCRWVNNPTQR